MGPLPSPEEAAAYPFTASESESVAETMSSHIIGDPVAVHDGLVALAHHTGADEFMLSTRTHSYEARLRSFSLIAETWKSVAHIPQN
jgi:alkanesulfonate monooxygenase SsuD/methylene tetrahydromethanopterin reductase-like flavin-dependent oxidoreductase (luciferase family)